MSACESPDDHIGAIGSSDVCPPEFAGVRLSLERWEGANDPPAHLPTCLRAPQLCRDLRSCSACIDHGCAWCASTRDCHIDAPTHRPCRGCVGDDFGGQGMQGPRTRPDRHLSTSWHRWQPLRSHWKRGGRGIPTDVPARRHGGLRQAHQLHFVSGSAVRLVPIVADLHAGHCGASYGACHFYLSEARKSRPALP